MDPPFEAHAEDGGPALLVVAEPEAEQRLRAAGVGPVVGVEDYLRALGEMTQRRIGAVVGTLAPMNGLVESTVRALRELAPHAELLLVVDADQEPQAMRAVRLGFDDYLVRPVDWSRLSDRLHLPRPDSPTSSATASPGEPATPTPAASASAGDSSPGEAEPSPRPASPDRPANIGERLTDADLIDQLLRDRRGVQEMAVEAIRQRLPGHDLRFVETGAAEQACAVEPVRFGRRVLGYLVSRTADPHELSGYAAWLARWLMLRRHVEMLHDMALHDELTGVWNRRYFERFLASILARARRERFRVTVMIYDIDDFKSYNDRYGHAAGDEILIETAKLMQSVVRSHDVVARVGGDEFAVIFWDAEPPRREHSQHPASVRSAAQRFQRAICEHRYPKLAEEAPGTLTVSGGLASYPWDGQDAEALMHLADNMLLETKRQGKNAMTFGPGAMKVCGMLKQRQSSEESDAWRQHAEDEASPAQPTEPGTDSTQP